jgi:hypothetical protein
MSNGLFAETGDTMVVTCPVSCDELADLDIAVAEPTVTVTGPGGFRHELELPGAALDRLSAELYHGILELRAPRS